MIISRCVGVCSNCNRSECLNDIEREKEKERKLAEEKKLEEEKRKQEEKEKREAEKATEENLEENGNTI